MGKVDKNHEICKSVGQPQMVLVHLPHFGGVKRYPKLVDMIRFTLSGCGSPNSSIVTHPMFLLIPQQSFIQKTLRHRGTMF